MSVEEFDLLAQVRRDTGQEGRRVGRDWLFRCPSPFHSDSRPSFAVSWKDDRWVYNCRSRCGGGDAAEYLVLMGRAGDQAAALSMLRGDDSTFRPVVRSAPVLVPPRPVAEPVSPPDAGSLLSSFLSRRGWTEDAASLFDLSVVTDRFGQPRVRFPWHDRDGQIVWFQDRALDSSSTRWLAPSGVACPWPFGTFEQQHILDDFWRQPTAFERGKDIWLCEGPADALALVSGFPWTVAHGLPGGNLSHSWVSAYSGFNVFIVFDNDASGEQFRETVRARLSPVAQVWDVRVPPEYNDLSEWQLNDEDFPSSLVAATTLELTSV